MAGAVADIACSGACAFTVIWAWHGMAARKKNRLDTNKALSLFTAGTPAQQSEIHCDSDIRLPEGFRGRRARVVKHTLTDQFDNLELSLQHKM